MNIKGWESSKEAEMRKRVLFSLICALISAVLIYPKQVFIREDFPTLTILLVLIALLFAAKAVYLRSILCLGSGVLKYEWDKLSSVTISEKDTLFAEILNWAIAIVAVLMLVAYNENQKAFQKSEEEICVKMESLVNDWQEFTNYLEQIKEDISAKKSYTREEYKDAYNCYEKKLISSLDSLLGECWFGIKVRDGKRDYAYIFVFEFYPKYGIKIPSNYYADILKIKGVSEKVKKAVGAEINASKKFFEKMDYMVKNIKERPIVNKKQKL